MMREPAGLSALPSAPGVAQGPCCGAPRGAGDQPQAHTARLARRGSAAPAAAAGQARQLTDGTAARLRAHRPNDVWALDFQFDETADLRRVKLRNIVDEFTREALAIHAARSIDADGVAAW